MQSNPVVHFEIYVEDMQRARRFYEAVLDVKLQHMPAPTPETADMEMWSFPFDPEASMNTYGSGGMLVKMAGMPPGGSGTVVYFACEDCAVQAARAVAHGGKLCLAKMSIGQHGFCAMAQDSEGNTIGFHSMQ